MRKIIYAVTVLFGVVTAIFFLFNVLSGDPARMMLGQNESAKQIMIIKKKYGFDKPLFTQYGYYINDLSPISFHSQNKNDYTFLYEGKYSSTTLFRLGQVNIVLKFPYLRESFQKTGLKVTTIILNTLPNTFILAFSAICIAILLGLFFGILSAINKGHFLDKVIQVISVLGMSIPSFFSAILFSWIFGFLLHDLTGLKMNGSLYEVDDFGAGKYIVWKNLILPSVVLGIRPLAVISQLMRNSLLEVLSQPYIITAYSKGLSQWQVIFKHALKNALNPVVTAISGWFAGMLAGAVFVEYIFGWNGLGKEIVNALNSLDFPVIMGAVLTISTVFIIINLFTDLIYKWLDPRVEI